MAWRYLRHLAAVALWVLMNINDRGMTMPRHWDTTPPPGKHPPQKHTPPREADYGIRSMSGRYASYWNAFLFESVFLFCLWKRTNIGVVQTHVQFHVISAKNILCLVLANGLHTIGIFSLFLLFHDFMTSWTETTHCTK